MRLVERNYLRETKGQQVAKYLEGLKPIIRDKIGVHILRTLSKAWNIALKVELMLQEKNRLDYSCKSYSGDNYWAFNDKNKSVHDSFAHNDQYKEEKAVGKQKVTDANEGSKAKNPSAKLITGKCFKCNQPGHRSSDCSKKQSMWWSEKKRMMRFVVVQMGIMTSMKMMPMARTMWLEE